LPSPVVEDRDSVAGVDRVAARCVLSQRVGIQHVAAHHDGIGDHDPRRFIGGWGDDVTGAAEQPDT
jgi:hypothetical protein